MADRYVCATYIPERGRVMADWLNSGAPEGFRLCHVERVVSPETVGGVYWLFIWERV